MQNATATCTSGACGFTCLSGLLSLVQHPRQTIPNPDRKVLSEHLSELNGEAGKVLKELANPQGNLTELIASRESFVAEGVGIIRARMADAATDSAVLAELQRRRGENQRVLAEFTT